MSVTTILIILSFDYFEFIKKNQNMFINKKYCQVMHYLSFIYYDLQIHKIYVFICNGLLVSFKNEQFILILTFGCFLFLSLIGPHDKPGCRSLHKHSCSCKY